MNLINISWKHEGQRESLANREKLQSVHKGPKMILILGFSCNSDAKQQWSGILKALREVTAHLQYILKVKVKVFQLAVPCWFREKPIPNRMQKEEEGHRKQWRAKKQVSKLIKRKINVDSSK